MSRRKRFAAITAACVMVWLLAIGLGSVFVSPADILKTVLHRLFGVSLGDGMPGAVKASIFWNLRLPRAALAFLTGAALAVSGTVMQSVLRNPLASSYTLGVSSGAALGAGTVILTGWAFLGVFTLPVFGFAAGMLTVMAAIILASKLDRGMGNVTVILTGMAFSMLANAAMTIMTTAAHDELRTLIMWQMGSFALKDWSHPLLLLPIVTAGVAVIMKFSGEMDLMTLGEEQAAATGVELVRVKWTLLTVCAVLTGSAVSLVGIIGFVDLFTPHVARRLVGARHRYAIPASALLGGCFMQLCDLAARTLVPPVELPVGAVTAVLGVPFFFYLYFYGNRRGA